jgi:hypothetical protein
MDVYRVRESVMDSLAGPILSHHQLAAQSPSSLYGGMIRGNSRLLNVDNIILGMG